MPHEINNGTDFVSVVNEEREEPWHRLGQRVDKAMTAEEALRLANLDFTVKLMPVFCINPQDEDDALLLPNKFATVAHYPDGKVDMLGVVGKMYTPVQNVTAFNFMDEVVDAVGGAHYDTAGFLRPIRPDGTQMAQVFLTINLEDAGRVFLDPEGANDELVTWVACCTSHDGSMAFTVINTTTRIVCKNTQQMALRGAKSKWVMKHTKNISGRMAAAREAVGLSLKYSEQIGKLGHELITQKYSDQQFSKLVKDLFPRPKDPTERQERTWNQQFDSMWWLWKEADTNDNIRGTKWAALQSVGEFLDWYRPVRGAKGNEDAKRATDSVVGWPALKKQRAVALLTK